MVKHSVIGLLSLVFTLLLLLLLMVRKGTRKSVFCSWFCWGIIIIIIININSFVCIGLGCHCKMDCLMKPVKICQITLSKTMDSGDEIYSVSWSQHVYYYFLTKNGLCEMTLNSSKMNLPIYIAKEKCMEWCVYANSFKRQDLCLFILFFPFS